MTDPVLANAPAATRFRPPGWRDPRFIIGLGLIAACVLAGGWLLAAADDTEPVWEIRADLPAGTVIAAGDLRSVQVQLPDATRARYYGPADRLPDGLRLTRDVMAGELFARSLALDPGRRELLEVPVSVAVDDLPVAVQAGSLVDVWVGGDRGSPAELVLEQVEVVSVAEPSGGFAPQSTRQVTLGVPRASADRLPDALAAITDGRVVLVRRATS